MTVRATLARMLPRTPRHRASCIAAYVPVVVLMIALHIRNDGVEELDATHWGMVLSTPALLFSCGVLRIVPPVLGCSPGSL